MTVQDFETLFDYGYWANKHFFEVMSHLSTEQFTQTVGGSYGPLRSTLVHMLSAEWGWLERCGGPVRGPLLNASDYPTLESVVDKWRQVEAWMREFLSRLQKEDLERKIEFSIGNGPKHAMPLAEVLHHAANHGVHHRGQLALLLRMQGYTPGNVDVLIYYGQRTKVAA